MTVAVLGADEVQVAALVKFWVVPSANCPMAASWTDVCSAIFLLVFGGAIVIDVNWDEVTNNPAEPLLAL